MTRGSPALSPGACTCATVRSWRMNGDAARSAVMSVAESASGRVRWRRRSRGSGDGPGRDVARMPPHELFSVALQGLRQRRLRAALSALGIAIGMGAMVACVGVSSSSQANLLAEIDALGTNLLTVSPGTTFFGNNEVLPDTAQAMIQHMTNVDNAASVYQLARATAVRSPYVPSEETGGIGVDATSPDLLGVVGTSLAAGHFIDASNENFPTVVLGAQG